MNHFGVPVRGRVNQLDASYLDSQLIYQFKEKLTEAFKLYHNEFKDKYEPELMVLLKALLFKVTVWDNATTYGAKLHNLVLVNQRTGRLVSRKTRALYGLITIVGPYILKKFEERQLLSQFITDRISLLINSLSLLNFVGFLFSGEYASIVLRLLGARWASATRDSRRMVNYEFQNRQLIWNALTEFLYFVIPLVNFQKIFRRVMQPQRLRTGKTKSLNFLSPRICTICFEQDSTIAAKGITNPYTAGCPHAYCYVCLALRLAEDPNWSCSRCHQPLSTQQLKPLT